MSKSKVAFAILILAFTSAYSAPIKGAGASSCGLWVEDRKVGAHFVQLNWVLGFISAYNEYVYKGRAPNGVFGNVDPSAIGVWLDNYCQANPLSTPYAGARRLVEELESLLPK